MTFTAPAHRKCAPTRASRALRAHPLMFAGLSIAAVAVGMLILLIVGFWPRNPSHFIDIADEFVAPESATLTLDSVVPAQWICLGDAPCPSVRRTWQLHGTLTTEQFTALVNSAEWGLAVNGPCKLDPSHFSIQIACRAKGVVEGVDVELDLRGLIDDPTNMFVNLNLIPAP